MYYSGFPNLFIYVHPFLRGIYFTRDASGCGYWKPIPSKKKKKKKMPLSFCSNSVVLSPIDIPVLLAKQYLPPPVTPRRKPRASSELVVVKRERRIGQRVLHPFSLCALILSAVTVQAPTPSPATSRGDFVFVRQSVRSDPWVSSYSVRNLCFRCWDSKLQANRNIQTH